MKLLVTGASGFLGQYVVAESLRQDHEVRAMIRPHTDAQSLPWIDDDRVEIVRHDLCSGHELEDKIAGVDAVLHLAAAKAGDFYAQFGGTVIATENLLSAMDQVGVAHIIAISSFSVYEYLKRWTFSQLDEASPLEHNPNDRDEYCRTKMLQEDLIRTFSESHNWNYVILRPGVIFGRDNLWNARLGMAVGSQRWIRTGAWAQLPLTYVENCAEAVVTAVSSPSANGSIINIVDDDTPTQRRFTKLLLAQSQTPIKVIPVAWTIMRCIARSAWLINQIFFGGSAKVPSIFVPSRLHARCKPLRYTNKRARQLLQWKPRYSLIEALNRSYVANPQELNRREPVHAAVEGADS